MLEKPEQKYSNRGYPSLYAMEGFMGPEGVKGLSNPYLEDPEEDSRLLLDCGLNPSLVDPRLVPYIKMADGQNGSSFLKLNNFARAFTS